MQSQSMSFHILPTNYDYEYELHKCNLYFRNDLCAFLLGRAGHYAVGAVLGKNDIIERLLF